MAVEESPDRFALADHRRDPRPTCTRVMAGTPFPNWSFPLSSNSSHCCTMGLLQRIPCTCPPLPPSHWLHHHQCLSCCHWEALLCPSVHSWRGILTLALAKGRDVMGRHLNEGGENLPFPRILPISLQFPSCSRPPTSPSLHPFKLPPLLSKPAPLPHLLSILWLTATSSRCYNNEQQPGQIGQPPPHLPACVQTTSRCANTLTSSSSLRHLPTRDCSSRGAAGPLQPPCASFPLHARFAAPQPHPYTAWTTFTLPHTPKLKHCCFGP